MLINWKLYLPVKDRSEELIFSFFVWVTFCCLIVWWTAVPGPAAAGYDDLAENLENNTAPDSRAVDSLPEPETARQHWLYGQVAREFDSSISHLKQAVTGAASEAKRKKYFVTWMRRALLGARSYEKFLRRYVEKFLNQTSETETEFWLLAGRLADLWEMNDLARKCYRSVVEQDSNSTTARLNLARLALEMGDYSRAEVLLEKYFLTSDTEQRSLYWLLRGRLFEARGADSEAYIAYSHIINNYSRSLLLKRAESEIGKLSLPEALYASSNGTGKKGDSGSTGESSPLETEAKQYYRVQVGSFRKRKRAQSLRRRLEKVTEAPVKIREARVDGTLYYRVKAGRAQSLPPAENLLEKLRQEGFQGYVTKDK